MKKRKAHEISDGSSSDSVDDDLASLENHARNASEAKRPKLASSPVRFSDQGCSLKAGLNSEGISNPLLRVEDVGPDDDIWLVKVPGHVNVDRLHDQILGLSSGEKSLLTLDDCSTNYVPVLEKRKSKLPLLLYDIRRMIRPVSVECKGQITLVEQFDVPEVGEIVAPPKSRVRKPENIRSRHPFFGLEEPPDVRVSEKENGPDQVSEKARKKNKKKKSKLERRSMRD